VNEKRAAISSRVNQRNVRSLVGDLASKRARGEIGDDEWFARMARTFAAAYSQGRDPADG
jgi:hypothetical protein